MFNLINSEHFTVDMFKHAHYVSVTDTHTPHTPHTHTHTHTTHTHHTHTHHTHTHTHTHTLGSHKGITAKPRYSTTLP